MFDASNPYYGGTWIFQSVGSVGPACATRNVLSCNESAVTLEVYSYRRRNGPAGMRAKFPLCTDLMRSTLTALLSVQRGVEAVQSTDIVACARCQRQGLLLQAPLFDAQGSLELMLGDPLTVQHTQSARPLAVAMATATVVQRWDERGQDEEKGDRDDGHMLPNRDRFEGREGWGETTGSGTRGTGRRVTGGGQGATGDGRRATGNGQRGDAWLADRPAARLPGAGREQGPCADQWQHHRGSSPVVQDPLASFQVQWYKMSRRSRLGGLRHCTAWRPHLPSSICFPSPLESLQPPSFMLR